VDRVRKSNAWHATREAQASWELRERFEELFEAAAAWRDHGDFDRLDAALEMLRDHPGPHTGFPPLDGKMSRDQRVATLAARYVTVSRFGDKVRQVANEIDVQRREIGDELRIAASEQGGVPEYERELLRHLRTEKIGQADLHPVSRALGRMVAQTIRDFNDGRRPSKSAALPDSYSDHPVSNWAALPAMFAGVELVELSPDDAMWPEPFPLPPSTDIATFTPDRVRPPLGRDRLETVGAWNTIIQGWAKRTNKSVTGMQGPVWALLLAHRMAEDDSDLSRFNGMEVQSPWSRNGVVRIEVLSEAPDDVPY
jgi:hypothetical protein